MGDPIVLLWLAISIAIILVLILKLKMNAALAMFVGALFMGFASGEGLSATVSNISAGFGNTMKGIGLSVGFGVMLSQLIADVGAVQTIANKILKAFGEKKADYALGATGFIVSIPVFYDVGVVILTPLAKQLSKKSSQKILPAFIGALVVGLGIAHTFIPPTPGPMTGGEMLGVPIGTTILWGIIIGLPTFILSMIVYNKVFLGNKKFWNPETCEEHDPIAEAEAAKRAEELSVSEDKLPSFFAALLPIFLPIVLILLTTVWGAIAGNDNVPDFIKMLGSKEIAMLCGVIAAMIVCLSKKRMTLAQVEKSITVSVASAGTVLLITGAGGGFGSVLTASGVGEVLSNVLASAHIPVIIFVWLIGALLRFAQGSGTVAMITAISLVSSMGTLGVSPILVALAAFSGSLGCAHVNDSGFWITTKIGGLTTEGGLKTYTLMCFIVSIISLALILVASLFI